jgi:catechol 2,3-dioxygenase-like lactoylglutathione lyase family enzyme
MNRFDQRMTTGGRAGMRRLWTIIGVTDVVISLEWYQELLGLSKSPPSHDYFGQAVDEDGTVLVCLHRWGDHDHPPLIGPETSAGNGLLLFFRVDDIDEALRRARGLVPELAEEPKRNRNTGTMEFAVRDPDGYYVMVSSLIA